MINVIIIPNSLAPLTYNSLMSDLLVERECKGTKKNVYVQTKFIFVAIDYFFLL